MKGDRCQQLTRTWRVISLLRCGGGATLAEMAAATGVSKRTIRRDLEALQAAGVAVYDEEWETARRYRLVKGAPCALCGRRPAETATQRSLNAQLAAHG